MKIGDLSLNLYSFGYSSGFIEDTKNKFKKISLEELVEKSKKLHLGGIEFPFDRFFTLENLHEGIEFLNELDKKNVNFYLDLEHFDIHYMEKIIPTLSKIGISSARIKMDQYGKTIYGGNRYLSGSFQEAKEDFIEKLSSISHCLKEYSFTLAIENHQDLSSTELVQIIESLDTYYLGINWDIGNSISCLDTPESFYKNTKHLIKNVHLKDYQVFDSEKGIRLVRCPIGEGYVDFSEYLKLIYNNQSIKSYSIELGAQITRENAKY
jgi:Xylose isomerase-like TIM barrel.